MEHIATLYSSSWVVWVLFVLLFVVLLNSQSQTNVLHTLRNISSYSERIYAPQSQSWLSIIFSRLYGIGVVSMAVLLVIYKGGAISWLTYLKVLAIVGVLFGLQTLLQHLIGWVFVEKKKTDNALEQYSVLRMLTSLLLYPIVLMMVNFPNVTLARILCGIVAGLYLLVVIGKCIQLFCNHMVSVLYIALYVLIIEILPLGLIVLCSQFVI